MTAKTTTVSTTAQLIAVARAAKAGDTILLAPGNYGDAAFSAVNPTGTITIRSADPDNDAVFRSLRINNISNVIFDDIDVSRTLRSGETTNGAAIQVNGSKDVTFVGLDVRGSMDGNAFNDGHGMSIAGGHGISILDSTFQQLRTTVIASRTEDFLFAGNTVSQVREGLSISSLSRGIVEQNHMSDWQGNYAAGDHPDMFQIHSGGTATASRDIIFRDNVMLPGANPVGGIFIRSEALARGERHENILIENNFYEGAYRHAITVANVDGAIVRNNTVLMGDNQGLVPAINLTDIRGGIVEENVSTMMLESTTKPNTGLTFSGNVDVWDSHFKKGIKVEELFAARDPNDFDFADLGVLATSTAGRAGAGFAAVAEIGGLNGTTAAKMAAWLPAYDAQFAVFGSGEPLTALLGPLPAVPSSAGSFG